MSSEANKSVGTVWGTRTHEARQHGANAFIGEATAVSDTGLQIKTKTGSVKVNYSSKTKFEHNEKPAAKGDLKVGDKVGVAGSKLPNGEVMANEVLIGYVDHPAPAAAAKKAAEHKHSDAKSDHKHLGRVVERARVPPEGHANVGRRTRGRHPRLLAGRA